VFLALPREHEWERFCALTGRADLARDARFATRQLREEHADALVEALQALFETDDADAWEARVAGAGLGCVRADGPVPGAFFLHDAQIRENRFTARVTHPQHGDYLRHGPIVRMRGVEERLRAAPMAGQHADTILAELGFTGAEIVTLRERNIIWSEPGVPVAGGAGQAT
jgi:crotonobetainyl-CoA:carnitine CoA-transferase CaiB-like acyl-CoA transferase